MGDALDAFFEKLLIIGNFDIHDRLNHGLGDEGKKAEGHDIKDKLNRIGFGNQAFFVPSGEDFLEHAGRSGGKRREDFSDKGRDILGSMDHLTADYSNDLFFLRKIPDVKGGKGFKQTIGGATLQDRFLDLRDEIKEDILDQGMVKVLLRGEIIKDHGLVDGGLPGDAVHTRAFEAMG